MTETYQGQAKGFHGPIKAKVVLDGDRIVQASVDYEPGTVGGLGLDRLADRVTDAGSVDVDAIAGATVSSIGFLNAVQKAVAVSKGEMTAEQATDPATPSPFQAADTVASASMNTNTVVRNPSPVVKPIAYHDGFDFDASYDIVVVGSGGAGLSAAVEAARAGLSVFISEKAGVPGGTTNFSGGVMQAAGTDYQKQLTDNQDDTPEKHARMLLDAGSDLVDSVLVKDITKHASENIDWLAEMGIKWQSVYGANHLPLVEDQDLADRIHVYDNGKGGGGQMGDGIVLTQTLLAEAQKAGAVLSLDSPTVALIQDTQKRRIYGVAVDVEGTRQNIEATRGVILATAGIDHNLELAKAFNPQHYADLQRHANRSASTNTGDGLFLGMASDAAVTGMGGVIDLEEKTAVGTTNKVPAMPMIFVNALGQRFVCEDTTYGYSSRAVFQQEAAFGKPTYMIFGEANANEPGSPWTADQLAAEVAAGTLSKAATLADLADKIGLSAINLEATVTRWNQDVAKGTDEAWNRRTGLKPIEGPYYAHRNGLMNLGAIGGLRINQDGQVLDTLGWPIRGLYAAGLNAGGWLGPFYPGSGVAIAGIVQQGRRAAQTLIRKRV
ncbi:FAD-dependent oxidoreductase [Secundilactobacillus kimchicus]|uniref:FAD-dependent oxidoreductase n=1 Tax=Secundilactobacillus kimchicus TaxID=528209 RepID=UPI001C0321E0|nr:FAD-dependent oxidoreductase [Secundilactobacillus kimchicus]MBT9671622.1 FAD-dependent oxidoreductase [Secundilactobacillus kimchicus]